MNKAKMILSIVYLGCYSLYFVAVYFGPKIARKVYEDRLRKAEHIYNMEQNAIDVEWRFV